MNLLSSISSLSSLSPFPSVNLTGAQGLHTLVQPLSAMGRYDFSSVREGWRMFSAEEKKNIAIYILGIMLYKFGLEAFNGSIVALATNRYDYESDLRGTPSITFGRVGLLTALNQVFQCIGSILIAPLIKRYPTKLVLSVAILVFAVFTAILLIVDAGTGGYIKPTNWSKEHAKDDFGYYGNYDTGRCPSGSGPLHVTDSVV